MPVVTNFELTRNEKERAENMDIRVTRLDVAESGLFRYELEHSLVTRLLTFLETLSDLREHTREELEEIYIK